MEEIQKNIYKSIYELEEARENWTTETKKQGMFDGFKNTLTKLYTKSGHFVFELIQNAEDCDAEEILFPFSSFVLFPILVIASIFSNVKSFFPLC